MAIAPKKLTRLLRGSSVRHLLAAGGAIRPLEAPRALESGDNPDRLLLPDQAPCGPSDRLAAELNAITARLCTGRARNLQPPTIPVLGPRTRTVVDPAEIARVSAGYLAWAETLVESLLALRETSTTWGS